jgi:hypothetical protein
MQRICTAIVLIVAVYACPSAARAGNDCARWEQQIQIVQQQMRRSHTAAQGNRLRARLRDLRERIAHDCR